MEHIAHAVGRDPAEVRRINLKDTSSLSEMLDEISASSDLKNRRVSVDSFNSVIS
jgi:xanthine dehydrogenase molybdopterin-binding subunit B